jgi:hypothetical protein
MPPEAGRIMIVPRHSRRDPSRRNGGAPRMPPAKPVTVPAGSTLVVRATGKLHLDVAGSGGLTAVTEATHAPSGTEEHRFKIAATGTANPARRQRRPDLGVQRHSRQAADDRADQALLRGKLRAARLLVDVERFLALLDHLAHDVADLGVSEGEALGGAGLAPEDFGVDQAERRHPALVGRLHGVLERIVDLLAQHGG